MINIVKVGIGGPVGRRVRPMWFRVLLVYDADAVSHLVSLEVQSKLKLNIFVFLYSLRIILIKPISDAEGR